jgi:crotonobetainyl-CoA:carnitine CoA-transferase CaiB-like acyl-CoA transferase
VIGNSIRRTPTASSSALAIAGATAKVPVSRDLLCAPVRSLGEALADPQTATNRMIVRYDGEPALGLVGSPVHLSDAELVLRHAPPALGGNGEAILAEYGFTVAEIAAFKAEGALG